MKIAKHRGMARARVAVARKLAVILHRMSADGAEFRFGKAPIALTPAQKEKRTKQIRPRGGS
jgi:hypothetical protein